MPSNRLPVFQGEGSPVMPPIGSPRRTRMLGAAMLTLAMTCLAVIAPAAPASALVAPSRPGLVVAPLATGPGSIVQTSFGTEVQGKPGNFDTVVLQGNQLVHYWRSNADPATVWQRGQVISTTATGPGSII